MITEDDAQLGLALTHFIGAIELFRIADMAPAIPTDRAVRRGAEHFLIRGDPADAVLGQKRQHALTHRTLGRPHALGLLAENAFVFLHGAANVDSGIFEIAARV